MNDTINDCYVDVFGKQPTDSQIKEIGEQLPWGIKQLANQWGWNDTEVGDKVYVWLEEQYEKGSFQG